MANRYWVNGTGNWSDDINHWSLTSGGLPLIGLLPTSSDDVFIDSNSGLSGGTITNDIDINCNDFSSTSGFTYIIDGSGFGASMFCYGSFTGESGLTIINGLYFLSTITGQIITCNNFIVDGVLFQGVNGSWTLQDDLTCTGKFYQENGTFDANDHNVTATFFSFSAYIGSTPTVIMGSGTWEGKAWYVQEDNSEVVTITPETSTIKIPGGSYAEETNGYFYDSSGSIYNNLWISGSDTVLIDTSQTFNDFKIDAGMTVLLMSGTTQTVSTFTAVGTVGNVITLNSSDGLTQFTLSKSSGTVNCDYLNISNSNATGGATWNAGSNSIDTTNNDGWVFGEAPVTTTNGASFLFNMV